MESRLRLYCAVPILLNVVLASQSSAIFSGVRQSNGGVEVHYNGQWLPLLPCNINSNECNYTVIGSIVGIILGILLLYCCVYCGATICFCVMIVKTKRSRRRVSLAQMQLGPVQTVEEYASPSAPPLTSSSVQLHATADSATPPSYNPEYESPPPYPGHESTSV